MKKNTLSVIAIIAILVLLVGVFAACKKKNVNETDVTVSTDENGSLYYTDPTQEVDGITYGGETHFVSPDETNKNGEYHINPDKTSAPYTTDRNGNVAPVTKETPTTAPEPTTGGGNNTEPGTTSGTGENPTQPTQTTTESTTEEFNPDEAHGIDNADNNNNLNDDGVINAW
jgi:hypothetical protein